VRILITGGCGFLGSNLARAMSTRGHDVYVFDNLSRLGAASNLAWLGSSIPFFHGDIRNANDVERCVAESSPDAVFHLAGQVAMTTSISNPRLDFEINALGSFTLLEALRRLRPEAIVLYASTNKVYGDLEWVRYEETPNRYVTPAYPDGFAEDLPFDPESPYGVSKGSADSYMREFHRTYGLRTVVFRHSSMYGGRQFATYDQGWIGWFAQKALQAANGEAEPFTVSGNGKQVRDVLHIDDLVELYAGTLAHIDDAAGQVFNIGGGMANSLSLLELFDLLEELTGTPLHYTNIEPRASDQRVFVADIAKASRTLGWTPHVPARAGIAATLEWISAQTAAEKAR
jgi:CDP-paratose 2-epimerase